VDVKNKRERRGVAPSSAVDVKNKREVPLLASRVSKMRERSPLLEPWMLKMKSKEGGCPFPSYGCQKERGEEGCKEEGDCPSSCHRCQKQEARRALPLLELRMSKTRETGGGRTLQMLKTKGKEGVSPP